MQITLKAARANKDLTREAAAHLIQSEIESRGTPTKRVTKDVIANWENGISYPNVIQLKAIEAVYDVGYNDLIFCQ